MKLGNVKHFFGVLWLTRGDRNWNVGSTGNIFHPHPRSPPGPFGCMSVCVHRSRRDWRAPDKEITKRGSWECFFLFILGKMFYRSDAHCSWSSCWSRKHSRKRKIVWKKGLEWKTLTDRGRTNENEKRRDLSEERVRDRVRVGTGNGLGVKVDENEEKG